MLLNKWKFAFVPAVLIMMFSSCMSVGKNLEPGQVVNEDEVFLVGTLDVGIKAADQPSWGMYQGIQLIFKNKETEKPEVVLVPVNERFFVKMPRADYTLEAVFYYLEAGYNSSSYVNMLFKDTEFNLTDIPMAYLGDIQLGAAQNPYGNYQRVSLVTNNYEETVRKTAKWLSTEEGTPVKPVDLSSAWDNTSVMSNPFRHQLINYRIATVKNETFIPVEGKKLSLDKSKSIAFLSGDMNLSTVAVAESLSDTAVNEYGVNALSQKDIANVLPLYPAMIYFSNIYDNYESNTFYYTIDDEEEYNSNLEPLLMSMGNKLGVDYLYLIYWVDGADASPDSGEKGMFGQNKNTLAVGMRGRLYDVKAGKMLGKSRIMEVSKPGFFNYDETRIRLKKMAESISRDLTKFFYK